MGGKRFFGFKLYTQGARARVKAGVIGRFLWPEKYFLFFAKRG